jgi:hypothetical protein
VDAARGSASMPMTEEEVAEKFRDCAAFARMSNDNTEKAIELILNLEKVADIRALTSVLSIG